MKIWHKIVAATAISSIQRDREYRTRVAVNSSPSQLVGIWVRVRVSVRVRIGTRITVKIRVGFGVRAYA